MACIVGSLDCLQYAVRKGATADYFTVYAAVHYGHWECLEWALRNGCPVACDDDRTRPHFVRVWIGDLFRKAVVRAERELEREAAARTLQAAWIRVYYDPGHSVCQSRLLRQFRELARIHHGDEQR